MMLESRRAAYSSDTAQAAWPTKEIARAGESDDVVVLEENFVNENSLIAQAARLVTNQSFQVIDFGRALRRRLSEA